MRTSKTPRGRRMCDLRSHGRRPRAKSEWYVMPVSINAEAMQDKASMNAAYLCMLKVAVTVVGMVGRVLLCSCVCLTMTPSRCSPTTSRGMTNQRTDRSINDFVKVVQLNQDLERHLSLLKS